ncbi:MAG TPA: Hsp20/alpha crystallin family protein [Caulobacteraceae bacterium]|nr:Hsp20/alpha crystallin family protein [Caulobacteraceae bacterium]
MPDPQAHPVSERTHNETSRSDGPPAGQAKAEPRSFNQSRSGQGAAAEAFAQATQPLVEGSRQLAEQSRRASRQVADNWRQAVDPLLAIQFEMSQWFDDMFRHAFGFRQPAGASPMRPFSVGAASLFGLPPADMKETDAAHILAVELPGLTREDIDLTIDGDALVVCGHKAEETDDASATYRVSERRYGRFERSFPLSPDVDRSHIAAQFKDGVLKITLPKNPAAATARSRIEIKG